MIARSCRLTVCGRPIVGSHRCGIIVLWLIDVRGKLLGGLWPSGCWDRTGVDVIAAGFGLGLYCITVFVVWVECVKALLVNVCYGTAKSSISVVFITTRVINKLVTPNTPDCNFNRQAASEVSRYTWRDWYVTARDYQVLLHKDRHVCCEIQITV